MKKKFFSRLIIPLLVLSSLSFVTALPVKAEKFFYLKGVDFPLKENYTIKSPDGVVKLDIGVQSTKQPLTLKMMNIVSQDRINWFFTYPEGLEPTSDLYFVKFNPTGGDNFTSWPTITIQYQADDKYKEVYYYSWLDLSFKKIDSLRDPLNQTLVFTLPDKKSIMFALFNEPELTGRASWYVHPRYPNELMAASRDFAIDSKVRVINLQNNKEVIVTIKDYGPKRCADWTDLEQKLMGPCQERVLDLSKNAFLKLATSTNQGIISQIKITPVDNLVTELNN